MSLARNTGVNLASSVLLVGVALVSVPLYIELVGLERYGVLSICWLLLGYLGLFDLGLGRAVTQGIAALPPGHSPEANPDPIFWTGLFASVALALVAFAVALPAGYLALRSIDFTDPALADEARRAVPLIACAVPVNIVAGVCTGALIGRSRFGVIGLIDTASSLAATAAPLVVAALGSSDLPALVAASLVARALSGLCAALAARRLVPIGPVRRPSRALLRRMLSFGGWVSLSNTVGPILSMWDRFVIGVMLGPRAVSVYVIPFQAVTRLLMAPEALHRALFPRLSGMDQDDAAKLCSVSVGALSLLMTPAVLAALLAIHPFFELWIGPALALEAARIAYLLVPGIWANALALVAFALLHAQRRASASALLHLAEVVPYVVLLWLAIRWFGVAGAAALWSLRTVVDAWVMFRISSAGVAPVAGNLGPFAAVLSASAAAVLLPPGGGAQVAALLAALALGSALAYRATPPEALALLRVLAEGVRGRLAARPLRARGSS
ncbi:oligosaccharide flippase family protein [Sphingomonas lenta]|uniref:Polysaccharide biosynthesis protein C-terminal domain-containing protein n=1 Tax=Sphingomonas lenta TaxID=1141887 RepID=A0A2A2SJ06_9SPHN|nr:oligosaccharide flippase family protein [Sphingomonas lenta]PAX09222.1 hypothetical protein CKY28_00155 [Sphingomonas lenta]